MTESQEYILKKRQSLSTIAISDDSLAIQLLLTHGAILNSDKNIKKFREIAHKENSPFSIRTIYWTETYLIKELFKTINEHFHILEQNRLTQNPKNKELKEAIDFITKMTRNIIQQTTAFALKIE
jgi:hypothetical protein